MDMIKGTMIFYLLMSVMLIFRRYKAYVYYNNGFFINPTLYVFLFSILYLIVPVFFIEIEFLQMKNISEDHLINNSLYSFYYSFVFLILYIITTDIKSYSSSQIEEKKYRWLIFIVGIFVYILSIYLIYKLYPAMYLDNRVDKIEYYFSIIKIPGLSFIKWQLIFFIIFMYFSFRKIKYSFFYTPFIIIDIMTSGRENFFIFLVLFLVGAYICKIKIRLRWLVLVAFLFLAIAMLRNTGTTINFLSFLFHSLGEFIFTWQSSILVENYNSQEEFYLSFAKFLIPSKISDMIFDYKIYQESISEHLNFGFGLGSSILLEGQVNSGFMKLLHPIILSFLYYFLLLITRRLNSKLFEIVIAFFLIILTYSIYRGSAYINLGIYTYILFFYMPYVFIFLRGRYEGCR